MLQREQLAGTPETGSNFVEYEQYAEFVAQLPQRLQVPRVIKPHPAGPLNDGLDDDGREFGVVRE